jgi:uncharacterized membrane protein
MAIAVNGVDLGETSSGVSPRWAACLAYSMWWASGALMLAIEPRNTFVRFHALQSLVGLGAAWLAGISLWGLAFLMAFVSPLAFRVTAVLGPIVWAVGIAAWLWCTWQAATGRQGMLPWAGRWAAARAERERAEDCRPPG